MFGEYSVVKGGVGLALPLELYYGKFKDHKEDWKLDESLLLNDFLKYLRSSGILSKVLDIKSFESDLKNGLYFDSNIAIGHGIGSSGALCAGLYYRYAYDFERKEQYTNDELKYLLDMMALMESFYHGASSGLDCLISLINKAVLIKDRNDIEVVEAPLLKSFGEFYLFDTQIKRKTAPLMYQFLQDYETDNYFRGHFAEFQDLSNSAIMAFLNQDLVGFENQFQYISHWQFQFFGHMIPKEIKTIWEHGLKTKEYFFKFCGAGGGGFFLIYTTRGINFDGAVQIS